MELQTKTLRNAARFGGHVVGQHDGSGIVTGSKQLELEVNQGARAPTSLKHVKRKLKVIVRLVMALPKLLSTILRPIVVGMSCLCVLVDLLWKRRILRFVRSMLMYKKALKHPVLASLSVAGIIVWVHELLELQCDPISQRTLWGGHTHAGSAKPGLYYASRQSDYASDTNLNTAFRRMQRILQNSKFFEDMSYHAPKGLISGDFTTVLPAILYTRKPLKYWRVCFPSSCREEPHAVTLDWCFPNKSRSDDLYCKILFIMAGVGGDSSAPYVQDAVHTAKEKGWISVVLMARGMGNSVTLGNIRNIFNPIHTHDVTDALQYISQTCPVSHIYLLGFSLGALTICNFLGRESDKVPENVKAAVAVSGGFEVGFMDWSRYASVYQPLLVPNLLLQVLDRYGHQLDTMCTEMEIDQLLTSSTYQELFERFFARLGNADSEEFEFKHWKCKQEGLKYRSRIKVPLLLFSACDDPLHNPDMIGAETDREVPIENPNVVYLLTEEGGHVGWPNKTIPRDFQYINSVFVRFFDSCNAVEQ